jgi:hypothetical protein
LSQKRIVATIMLAPMVIAFATYIAIVAMNGGDPFPPSTGVWLHVQGPLTDPRVLFGTLINASFLTIMVACVSVIIGSMYSQVIQMIHTTVLEGE